MYDEEKELDRYLKNLADHPDNCVYLNQVAFLYLNLEQFDKAVISYESTVQKCPKDAMASFSLGEAYYITGRTDLGLRQMEAGIRVAADQGDKKLEVKLREVVQSYLERAKKNDLPEHR
jgi:tetratricopeptide (TPR) repeat protein